jgi:xylitol oxidase
VTDADAATNWAGNVTFRAARVHRPSTVDELRAVVGRAGRAGRAGRLRALGTGHSFSTLADTTGDLVSVAGLPRTIELDRDRRAVRVAAGVRYGELAVRLHEQGDALHNLASLPHISVAGACATGTHGSGDRNGNLATAVSAVELVTATGDLVTLGRDDGRFAGTVVGLGSLGVVTALTLDVLESFEVRQDVFEDLPREALGEHWRDIFAGGYSVSLFTDWTGPNVNQVWRKRRAGDGDGPDPDEEPSWFGARRADGPRHPVPGMPADPCTEQLGVPGPWHERLPHFRLDFTPSTGAELQSEYLLPREAAIEAFDAVDRIRDRVARVVQVSEVRTIAADDLWMSPSYGRDSVALHFTWIRDAAAVAPVMAAVEERLAPLGARPHWGKLFGTGAEALRALYPRYDDFARLMRDLDPAGAFRNDLIDACFPDGPGA